MCAAVGRKLCLPCQAVFLPGTANGHVAFASVQPSALHLIVRVPSAEYSKKADTQMGICFFGTPEGTRTPDLLVRSQSLYPTELPAHTALTELQYSITTLSFLQVFF